MERFEEGEKYYCNFVDTGNDDYEIYYKKDNWINILKRVGNNKCKVEWHLSHLKPQVEEVEIYYNKDSRAIEEEVIAMPGNDDYEFFYIFHPYN